jgi:hypothetical protein
MSHVSLTLSCLCSEGMAAHLVGQQRRAPAPGGCDAARTVHAARNSHVCRNHEGGVRKCCRTLPCSVLRVVCTLLDLSRLLHCLCLQELMARLKTQTHVPLDAWHIRYGELKVAV